MSLPSLSETFRRRFEADGMDAGRRLGEVLADRFGWVSRLRLRRLVRDGLVTIAARPADWGRRLAAGETIEIQGDLSVPTGMRPEAIPLRIVYEDEHLLAVDKPAGMLVHPSLGVKSGTLANALSQYLNPELVAGRLHGSVVRPALVNRLDRATSGLVLVAKTSAVARVLGAAFRARKVKKLYRTVVSGRVQQDEMEIRQPVGRVSEHKPQWNVTPEGKPAHTRLSVVKRREAETLVALEPTTGRTNQLRIHCAAIGHAILGDEVYGAPPYRRLMLHAHCLELRHPVAAASLRLTAEPPKEFEVRE